MSRFSSRLQTHDGLPRSQNGLHSERFAFKEIPGDQAVKTGSGFRTFRQVLLVRVDCFQENLVLDVICTCSP